MDMKDDNKTREGRKDSKKGGNRRRRMIVTVITLLVMCWGIWQFTSMALSLIHISEPTRP